MTLQRSSRLACSWGSHNADSKPTNSHSFGSSPVFHYNTPSLESARKVKHILLQFSGASAGQHLLRL